MSAPTIQAIETKYKGWTFRSRLEARWAIFFDSMGLEFSYEPETFRLSGGTFYLPDFYLPMFDLYIEIKPSALHVDGRPEALAMALSHRCHGVMVGIGAPKEATPLTWYRYDLIENRVLRTKRRGEMEFRKGPGYIFSGSLEEEWPDDGFPDIALFRQAVTASKRRWS